MQPPQSSVKTWSGHLPGRCQVCGCWPAQPICDTCLQRHAAPRHRCDACATPVVSGHHLCGACLTRQSSPALTRCLAALDYGYPWDGLIARWKFQGEIGWSPFWASLMWRDPALADMWRHCTHVVPVPMDPARLAERGYNQAWELTKALLRQSTDATATRDRLRAQALVRTRETADQHRLSRSERLRNLRNAMAVHPLEQARLAGQHVLLVDDVSTTGATLEASAQALLDGGAAQVSACVLARTPPPD